MRFLYGTIFGVLVTVVAAILYLAVAGGEYLLRLSPEYHDMKSRVANLEKADEQRDMLMKRLETLEEKFQSLRERFTNLSEQTPPEPPTSTEESPPEAGEE